MKIAITAVSGKLGNAITQLAVRKLGKQQIIAIARTPENVAHMGIEVRQGDYNDLDSLRNAFENIDTLLLVSSNEYPPLRIKQHTNVIDMAKEQGVKKLVYTSIAGKEGENTYSEIIKSHRDTEKYLRASGLSWIIGKNGLYIEPDLEFVEYYLKTGKIRNSGGKGKCAYTTYGELAEAYVNFLESDIHNNQSFFLGGEAISQRELAQIIGEVYQRPVMYEEVEPEEYTQSLIESMGTFMGRTVGGMYHGIRQGAFNFYSDFENITGRKHISMKDFFSQHKIDMV